MKATYQKILCLTLIVSLTLNACENQAVSGASGNTPFSRNNLLNLKGNVRLTNPDYREDIFELNDVAVFDESGVGGGVFYIDSTKGLQILTGVKLPPEILKSNVKFVEFMKSEKDNFQPIATNYPKPDNSLAMHYDAVHGALHWVYNIMLKYNDEFGAFNDSEIFLFRKKLSKQPHLEVNVKTVYKNYADFINPRTKKRWPLLGAAIGSATSAGLLINDTYSQVANFIWGGCGNFPCSSAYFYGDKSESVVSIKADALYQQVAFNDSKVNYKLNVVQVFSQTCIEMIRNSAESNLAILYAKTGERHYLISDVNNKLCPIGDMDMSKFIESAGVTQ